MSSVSPWQAGDISAQADNITLFDTDLPTSPIQPPLVSCFTTNTTNPYLVSVKTPIKILQLFLESKVRQQ